MSPIGDIIIYVSDLIIYVGDIIISTCVLK